MFITIDGKTESVEDWVEEFGNDLWGETGALERTREEIKNTRAILARLMEALAEKQLFTQDELVEIIRGY